jgi:hypothetical protein
MLPLCHLSFFYTFYCGLCIHFCINDCLISFLLIYFPSKEPSSVPDSSTKNDTAGEQDGNNTVASPYRNENVEGEDILPSSNVEVPFNAKLASLSTGEVTFSLSCTSVLWGPDIFLPSHDPSLKTDNVEIYVCLLGGIWN